ncbi:hypothetical protein KFL_008060030 [Klebsormidium nitens]|uniref:Uncharacterized protein n=1 Tax=Klebsormidium nitens TaxID=105231 RepID=A0A1Y1ISC9_KLENI|nr:hypothetical protein KFL_008060030 [Klebsormidium nitens]|eukprot:GAQ91557.1 hypothetical protein KFL_008060030 [Klebsormidium nitens]
MMAPDPTPKDDVTVDVPSQAADGYDKVFKGLENMAIHKEGAELGPIIPAPAPPPALEEGDPLAELRKAGKVPPKTIIYDPQSPFIALIKMGGTALEMVLMRPDFYLIMLVHVFLCLMYYQVSHNPVLVSSSNGSQQSWPFLSPTTIVIPGTMIVFFMVFHTSQAYSRFFEQYLATARVDGRINNRLTPLFRMAFADDCFPGARETRMLLARYAVSIEYLGYANLPFYKANGAGEWAWKRVEDTGLLTPTEVAILRKVPNGKAFKELSVWMCHRLHAHFVNDDISNVELDRFVEYTNDLVANIGIIYDYMAMPVPFAFFHLLNAVLVGYLLLLAYTYCMYSYYYSIIGMLLTTVSLLGLRELSCALSDPFGSDATDLPVFDYAMAVHRYVNASILDRPEGLSEAGPGAKARRVKGE